MVYYGIYFSIVRDNFMDKYMKEALLEAKEAYIKDEVPVGAVIVYKDRIIARAHNLRESSFNAVNHAEIIAIEKACRELNNWRLSDCSMYVTLEPCVMCMGAILQSRITNLYIGAFDLRAGCAGTIINLADNPHLSSGVNINWNIEPECSKILENFFKQKRNKKEKLNNGE